MVSGLRPLSLSDALSCTHGPGLGGFELGHFPTGMVTSSRSELKWAGDQKKSCPLSRALAAQVPGERGACHRLVFSAGLGTSCDFFLPPYSTKPGQTAMPTPAHRSSVEPLLSQPHSVSCNWIFLPLYSTSVFVFWLFFRVFSQTIPPVSQGSSKL